MADLNMYCTACGYEGPGEKKGSILVTLLLLCVWIVPGIIYEVWRCSGQKQCPSCKASALIPAHSPKALEANLNKN
jgi:hypothetical protein